MMWTHWLLRLDDRCPGCAILWFTGGCRSRLEVLELVRAVSHSWTIRCRCWLQRLCHRCLGFFNTLVNWGRIDVVLSVDASPSIELLVD